MLVFNVLFAVSIDCPNVINLAYGMNMHLIQPLKWYNLTNYDCCDSKSNVGIQCTNERIITLKWSSLNLNGTLNATAIPISVTTIDFQSNRLSGTIPSIPINVLVFLCSANMFTGTLPELSSSIDELGLSQNQFVGQVPKPPQSLRYLYLHTNKLNGTIPLVTSSLVHLYLGNNLLTGTIPTLLLSLTALSLYSNLLEGNIPSLPNSLLDLYLDKNRLSGCIPPMLNLYYIYLTDNPLLEGALNVTRATRIDISNTSISELVHKNAILLTSCVLSNTPLLGKVDGFTQCARSNLFTKNSSCGSTSHLYSNSYFTLPSTSMSLMHSTASPISTSIDLFSELDGSSTVSTFIDSLHTFEVNSTYTIKATTKSSLPVPIRLTRKINDQAKSISSQIDQKSTTPLIKTTLNRQTSTVSTTSISYLEPKSVDFQNIKFTLSLAIRLFINWGLIIYIITESKRLYTKRTKKNTKILSMSVK